MYCKATDRILWLGPDGVLAGIFEAHGCRYCRIESPLPDPSCIPADVTLIVSYGYRHLIRSAILDHVEQRAVNLHISLLPWNRGADPNLWSFLEDTPKGVTVHWVDPGIDTGPILAQTEVTFGEGHTLTTSYTLLQNTMVELFASRFEDLLQGTAPRTPQIGTGTLHRARDKEPFLPLLTNGWDTPVSSLVGKAKRKDGEQ